MAELVRGLEEVYERHLLPLNVGHGLIPRLARLRTAGIRWAAGLAKAVASTAGLTQRIGAAAGSDPRLTSPRRDLSSIYISEGVGLAGGIGFANGEVGQRHVLAPEFGSGTRC